jgi:CNT family concentrative nucleoside transporter
LPAQLGEFATMVVDAPREGHNSSPMPGVAHNPDPALDPANQHHHDHLHHGANAEKGHTEKDHVAYTSGTTFNDPGVIPQPSPIHDIEKAKLEYGEKGKHAESDTEPSEANDRHRFRSIYRRYRIVFHILIGAFFTG